MRHIEGCLAFGRSFLASHNHTISVIQAHILAGLGTVHVNLIAIDLDVERSLAVALFIDILHRRGLVGRIYRDDGKLLSLVTARDGNEIVFIVERSDDGSEIQRLSLGDMRDFYNDVFHLVIVSRLEEAHAFPEIRVIIARNC